MPRMTLHRAVFACTIFAAFILALNSGLEVTWSAFGAADSYDRTRWRLITDKHPLLKHREHASRFKVSQPIRVRAVELAASLEREPNCVWARVWDSTGDGRRPSNLLGSSAIRLQMRRDPTIVRAEFAPGIVLQPDRWYWVSLECFESSIVRWHLNDIGLRDIHSQRGNYGPWVTIVYPLGYKHAFRVLGERGFGG